MLTDPRGSELDDSAYQIRRLCVDMITWARWGHVGGSFSIAEILSALYFEVMGVNPALLRWEDRDRLVLSEAHASPTLDAALAQRGSCPLHELQTHWPPLSRLLPARVAACGSAGAAPSRVRVGDSDNR